MDKRALILHFDARRRQVDIARRAGMALTDVKRAVNDEIKSIRAEITPKEDVLEAIRAAVAALPPPEDGEDGNDGEPGKRGLRGLKGLRGQTFKKAYWKTVKKQVGARAWDTKDYKHLILVLEDGTELDSGPIDFESGGILVPRGMTEARVRELINMSTSPLGGYRIADEDSSGDTKYYGYTNDDGPKWYILRIDHSIDPIEYRYARGDSGYTTNWTGRTGLAYTLRSNLSGF